MEDRAMVFRSRNALRRTRRIFAETYSHCNAFRTSPCFTMFSRSVASTASVPKRQVTASARPSSHLQSCVEDFLLKVNAPQKHGSLGELWDAFLVVRNESVSLLKSSELFTLGWRIARGEEALSTSNEAAEDLLQWGQHLQDILTLLRRRLSRESVDTLQHECLTIVALSLQGHFEKATPLLNRHLQYPPEEKYRLWIVDAYKHTLLSILRHSSPSHAFDFYLDNRYLLKSIINAGSPLRRKTLGHTNAPLFKELSTILGLIPAPDTFLAEKRKQWSKVRMAGAGQTMMHIFTQANLAEDALAVYEELRSQNIQVYYYVRHALVRALVRAERFERANAVYATIAPTIHAEDDEKRSYESTGLHLFAHQGYPDHAEECFASLSARGDTSPQEKTLIMHAYAMQGNVERVIERFEGFFGKSKDELSPNPNSYHYSTVIHAFVKLNDFDGINKWLGLMTAAGHNPDTAIYNIVLKGIAQRGDIASMHSLLDQMRSANIPLDSTTYTTVIKVLARRRDVVAAESMFKRMVHEGIVPDRIVVTTIMNAHVEAGSWKGVIRVFDYLQSMPTKELRLGIEVFNTLLKAYVLIGSPLHIVTDIFRRLEMADVKPTNHTFALLIQSACDSGRMDIASKLFVEMESLSKNLKTNVQVTAHVLTIIMTAFLRKGLKAHARAVYDDMRKRGIQPTLYTFASILRVYSKDDAGIDLQLAKEFLATLQAVPVEQRTWAKPQSGREGWLTFAYAPLLQAYSKNLDTEEVERLYAEYADNNERPSITILASLLDVYRRTDNIQGVHHVWPQIYEIALSRTDEVDPLLDIKKPQSQFLRSLRRSDLLCVPLSIYIDAVSRAGQHIEVAHTWNKLREAGFHFDAHNWNHLVVALVRAGQPKRAFEVMEKVILPYHAETQVVMRKRPRNVSSPLLFDDEEEVQEAESEPFVVHLYRSGVKRAATVARLRRRLQKLREDSDDIVHPLHVMQQISPAWNVWRPHSSTMRVLAEVIDELNAGRPIRPTKLTPRLPPTDAEIGSEADSQSLDEAVEREDSQETETESAEELLREIMIDNPQTIRKLDLWSSGQEFMMMREKGAVDRSRGKLHQSLPRHE
ncbi:hypothetical protein EW145_g2453 [Phellinidium pouzarii]|uniref:Pentacotripeptide-repeat region of PRORP domain-containing protein n=1 Tax=Phellinidium pouzarii TaxID=167371 RepID=A0A4S4LAW8_9AGAM|nr:hypothetical protein EW145_g2453 [Phellinidium pouzarii]